jgi:hypothetical protein
MIVSLIVAVIMIGISIALQYALRPKSPGSDSFVSDSKPTTLASRGAFSPYILGRRRIGANFLWAGDRQVVAEDLGSAGGKGSGKPDKQYQYIYYESCWHAVCVGPAFRLHNIWMDGKVIFKGPIDAVSFPSGSTIDLGSEGAFSIYWGEYDQPLNSFLADASRVNINSRWPFMCYIVWNQKRLTTVARWPLIDYEIETRIWPNSELPVAGPGWFEANRTLFGLTYSVYAVTNGVPATAKIRLLGKVIGIFNSGDVLQLAGNSNTPSNGDYKVSSVVYVPGTPTYYTDIFGHQHPTGSSTQDYTDVFLDTTLSGATATGTIQVYASAEDDGINGAYALSHLLFDAWPHGMGLDPRDFDLSTLDSLSQVCVDEDLPMSVLASNGQDIQTTLSCILQDLSCSIGWDVRKGKYVFRAARADDPAGICEINGDMLLQPNPQIDQNIGPQPVDKLMFTFADRATNYRDNTVTVDNDAQGTLYLYQKPRSIQLATIISLTVANRVAERRFQEEMSSAVSLKFTMNREARMLVPGQTIVIEGYPGSYRVESLAFDPLSGKCDVSCIADVYGVDATAFTQDGGNSPNPSGGIPKADLAVTLMEVPAYIAPGIQQVIVPRIRSAITVTAADLYLSQDDSTYNHMGSDGTIYTGGTLIADLPALGLCYDASNPVIIQALGPDIGKVQDLSGDDASWRSGRQFALIGQEVCYLQSVTALGGGQYRLNGLIRARFDTSQQTHLAGAVVFILPSTAFTIRDVILAPNITIYCKASPKSVGSIPLSAIPSFHNFLYGKGLVPMPMGCFKAGLITGSNSYHSGEDIPVSWRYRSTQNSRSGMGLQLSGSPCAVSAPEGVFNLVFLTTGNVVKRTVAGLASPVYNYANADLVADFGSEPASFKAQVTNVNGGLASPTEEITIVKV